MISTAQYIRLLLGILYVFSGLTKLIDPEATRLIIEHYLIFFHLSLINEFAKYLGLLVSFTETAIGLMALWRVWNNLYSWLICSIQLFFTLLSAIMLLKNPSMDCGCFGILIKLSHSQTFFKNIIISLLILLFLKSTSGKKIVPFKYRIKGYLISLFFIGAITVYSLISIPLIDFSDFRKGTRLVSSGEKHYSINEKADKVKELPLISLYDSNKPIFNEGKWCIVSMYNSSVNDNILSDILENVFLANDREFKTVFLTSFNGEKFQNMLNKVKGKYPIYEQIETDVKKIAYYADYDTILSLNRSNGGVTILENGIISAKYSMKFFKMHLR